MESPTYIHVIAAKRLFDDAVACIIVKKVAVRRAKRLEKICPAAACLLRIWITQWKNPRREVMAEETQLTDDEFEDRR